MKIPSIFKNGYDDNGLHLNEVSITDILEINELQALQDAFARSNSIASTITDTRGNPITQPSNHSPVCTLIRNTSKGLKNCVYSGKMLGRRSSEQGKPVYKKCYSVGFIDASAPIVIEGMHVANWLIGQNCIGDVDEIRIQSYAEEIDADKGEMLQAFSEMTRVSETEFKKKLDFLWIMANQLSRIAYQKVRNSVLLKDLKKATLELEGYREHLELLVEKKSSEIKRLSGLLPLCSFCKKIRDDKGSWNQVDEYIADNSEADVSHSICPDCAKKHYPDMDLFNQ